MIVVSELVFSGGAHVPFNAGLLAVIRTAFPLERICFAGASGYIRELKEQADEALAKSIEWREIDLLPADTSYFVRLLREMKTLRTLFRIIPEGTTGPFLLTHAKPATLVALKLLRRLQFRKIKVQFVLHGPLGGVIGRRHCHPIRRFQDMKTALTILGNDNLQYIVLEESLKTVLLKNLPVLEKKVAILPHPLPPNESESNADNLKAPIQFGFLGLANKPKGFPVFVKLAQEIVMQSPVQAEFHAIGRVSSDGSVVLEMEALATKPGMERLSRRDYINKVHHLHFIILPHEGLGYELKSSGTLLDALAWAKPLIARRIALFENMFVKYGDIGYLFTTDLELKSIVERIIQEVDRTRYHQQVLNIERARSSRTPKALSVDYRKICEKMDDQNSKNE
ncbi:MAG: hypothetical protein WD425_16650 [Nitrospirales bacterium]